MDGFRIVQTDGQGMELVEHGSAPFPLDNIYDDFSIMDTVEWHWHTELEIGVLLRGSLHVSIDTEKYYLKEGDAFFINSEVLHFMSDPEHSGCLLRSVVFHPRLVGASRDSVFFQGYVNPLLGNHNFKGMIFRHDDKTQGKQIENLLKAIALCDGKPVGYELLTRSLLSEIILYLFAIQHHVQEEVSAADRRNELRFREMLRMIEMKYHSTITLKDLADAAFISKTECIRCFKCITGRTPIQYIKEYRLQKAAKLLASTDMNISRAAESCGFLEMSYFTRCFRKQYSMTPSEYRKQARIIMARERAMLNPASGDDIQPAADEPSVP